MRGGKPSMVLCGMVMEADGTVSYSGPVEQMPGGPVMPMPMPMMPPGQNCGKGV